MYQFYFISPHFVYFISKQKTQIHITVVKLVRQIFPHPSPRKYLLSSWLTCGLASSNGLAAQ